MLNKKISRSTNFGNSCLIIEVKLFKALAKVALTPEVRPTHIMNIIKENKKEKRVIKVGNSNFCTFVFAGTDEADS